MKRAVRNVHLSKLDHFSFHKVNKTIDERMLILPKAMSISPHNIWMLYDVYQGNAGKAGDLFG